MKITYIAEPFPGWEEFLGLQLQVIDRLKSRADVDKALGNAGASFRSVRHIVRKLVLDLWRLGKSDHLFMSSLSLVSGDGRGVRKIE